MTIGEFIETLNLTSCQNQTGFIVHGLVAVLALILFIWWTNKKALMSFRAWSLFMFIVHLMYFFLTCDYIRCLVGITMTDIFFIRGVELLATFITILRLYFIIEAHGIDISNREVDINPFGKIADSLRKSISIPSNPGDINGNRKKMSKKTKTLREKLIKLLF